MRNSPSNFPGKFRRKILTPGKFRPSNPPPLLTLSDRAEIHKLRSPMAQELIREISARSDNSFPVFQKPRISYLINGFLSIRAHVNLKFLKLIEKLYLHTCKLLAQLVERETFNPRVKGSSPSRAVFFHNFKKILITPGQLII